MKTLQIKGLVDLSKQELVEIEAGKNPMEYLAEGLGWLTGKLYNAWDEFKAGWNSVNCDCE